MCSKKAAYPDVSNLSSIGGECQPIAVAGRGRYGRGRGERAGDQGLRGSGVSGQEHGHGDAKRAVIFSCGQPSQPRRQTLVSLGTLSLLDP